MGAHSPLSRAQPVPGRPPGARAARGSLAPAGERTLGWSSLPRLLERCPQAAAERLLQQRLGGTALAFHVSGRAALRSGLRALAARSGRTEVVIPAYTCFSVAAAAVAAGLRVRLVEVTASGGVDAHALACLPLERAAALVVCNLFGIPEPLAPLRAIAADAGAVLIDDAAQCFGAVNREGPAGGRGSPALLSFGRGKPLCALGGGALAWPADADFGFAQPLQPTLPAQPLRALTRLAAHEVALTPWVFRTLAAIPALAIGLTRFDPGFARGSLDGAAAPLLLHALRGDAAASTGRRRRAEQLAARIRESSAWRALLAPAGVQAVYPRLALLAPSAAARARALAALTAIGAGASALYPSALCDLAPLRPHLAAEPCTPGARELAAHLLTLPTHGGLGGARLERALAVFCAAGA